MKNLVKTLTLLVVALFCAQLATAQVKFGARAGVNLANMSGDVTDTKMLFTFHLGGIAEFPISDMLAFQTGLELQGKGAKQEFDLLGTTYKSTINPMYLQVPLNIMYKGSGFYAAAGPYVGFGIAGKAKVEDESESLKFGSSADDDFSALDFGLNIGAGVSLSNGLMIGAQYGLGLGNAAPKDVADDFSIKHGVIGISVGYMFGGGDN